MYDTIKNAPPSAKTLVGIKFLSTLAYSEDEIASMSTYQYESLETCAVGDRVLILEKGGNRFKLGLVVTASRPIPQQHQDDKVSHVIFGIVKTPAIVEVMEKRKAREALYAEARQRLEELTRLRIIADAASGDSVMAEIQKKLADTGITFPPAASK